MEDVSTVDNNYCTNILQLKITTSYFIVLKKKLNSNNYLQSNIFLVQYFLFYQDTPPLHLIHLLNNLTIKSLMPFPLKWGRRIAVTMWWRFYYHFPSHIIIISTHQGLIILLYLQHGFVAAYYYWHMQTKNKYLVSTAFRRSHFVINLYSTCSKIQ